MSKFDLFSGALKLSTGASLVVSANSGWGGARSLDLDSSLVLIFDF